jgi:cell division protein FtsB
VIVEKLEELEQHTAALDAEIKAFDDDDDPYDPTEFIDEEDEF